MNNPIDLFKKWYSKAKETEINDPNALALATSDKNNQPSVRMVLLKIFLKRDLSSIPTLIVKKSDLKSNNKASMCFHWKSLRRQIRIIGEVKKISDEEADNYFNSRPYKNRIGAWASDQSQVLKKRELFNMKIEEFQKKYPENKKVPRPHYWSGWRLVRRKLNFG